MNSDFIRTYYGTAAVQAHKEQRQTKQVDVQEKPRRESFSQRLWRTQDAGHRAPGLFLAFRGCLAFDARSESSSRATGCRSRRALNRGNTALSSAEDDGLTTSPHARIG